MQQVGRLHVFYKCWTSLSDADETTVLAQQIIPKKQVLELLREGVGGGHLGMEKTLSCLKEISYWPGHYTDIADSCRSCTLCSSRKDPPTKARAPLQNIKAGCPLQAVTIDIMGPFPKSAAGNTHILVASDYFTRWVEAYAIPNLSCSVVQCYLSLTGQTNTSP